MVTGSNFLVEGAGKRFLVDCGMYQGKATDEMENEAPFLYNPADIDFIMYLVYRCLYEKYNATAAQKQETAVEKLER